MDEKRVEDLVNDVLARRRIEGDLRPAEGRLASLSRHPITLTIAAFVFTTGLTWVYDDWVRAREAEQLAVEQAHAEAVRMSEEGVAALRTFVGQIHQLQTRARFLEWAIHRGNKDEAIARKRIYDDVLVKWMMKKELTVEHLSGYLTSRAEKEQFTTAIRDVIDRNLTQADMCLTAAYDAATRAGFPEEPSFTDVDGEQDCAGKGWREMLKQSRERVSSCTNELLAGVTGALQRETARTRSRLRATDGPGGWAWLRVPGACRKD